MAKNKLQAFTRFANTLLPHETQYLLSIHKLVDEQKVSILERVHHNCTHIKQFTPYDIQLDKRKYSNLKRWIQKRLSAIDVDEEFSWMVHLEKQITTDAIQPPEEEALLRKIPTYTHSAFYFLKFYELLEAYQQFLLIRLRHRDYKLVNRFLEDYRSAYQKAKQVGVQLHEASKDITQQYLVNNIESIQWERWLLTVFYNEELDGLTRYTAFVRLTFIGFNYRKFDFLQVAVSHLDQLFAEGRFYSKRILLNFYHLRMMLNAKLGSFDQAVNYGLLSIRERNHDFLFYVNNLSAVLLRAQRPQEALKVMRDAAQEMKHTQNFYNKIGFVAFYVQCLLQNQMIPNAISYCRTFLNAYEREILQYRWHTFFTVYLEALLLKKDYVGLLQIADKYQLPKREETYKNRVDYLPNLDWYIQVARCKNGQITQGQLRDHLQGYLSKLRLLPGKHTNLETLVGTLRPIIPEVVNYLHLTFKYENSAL